VRVGDIVLKRSIYDGRVRRTFPHRYVGTWDGRIGLYCGPGNQGKAMRRGPDGYLRRWITDAPPFDTEEDELEEAVQLGIWTDTEAVEIRAEGERVIAEHPWPTGWEDWRPPAAWAPLTLPEDWHVV
jgi:hypothetical protein